MRKILAPFSFSLVQLFSPLFPLFFISFLSVLYLLYKSIFRYVFTETIILLGLAEYQMIITNLVLRALLVIYHLIFGECEPQCEPCEPCEPQCRVSFLYYYYCNNKCNIGKQNITFLDCIITLIRLKIF